MAGVGGYQAPSNPATVSGAGAFSQRTDGGIADKKPLEMRGNGEYGSTKAVQDQLSGAPLGRAEEQQQGFNRNAVLEQFGINPESAQAMTPTANPIQPVTAGARQAVQGASIDPDDMLKLQVWMGQVRASIASGRASNATKAMYYNLKRFIR